MNDYDYQLIKIIKEKHGDDLIKECVKIWARRCGIPVEKVYMYFVICHLLELIYDLKLLTKIDFIEFAMDKSGPLIKVSDIIRNADAEKLVGYREWLDKNYPDYFKS